MKSGKRELGMLETPPKGLFHVDRLDRAFRSGVRMKRRSRLDSPALGRKRRSDRSPVVTSAWLRVSHSILSSLKQYFWLEQSLGVGFTDASSKTKRTQSTIESFPTISDPVMM